MVNHLPQTVSNGQELAALRPTYYEDVEVTR